MKLKNKTNQIMELRDSGVVIQVLPYQTIEVSKPKYDSRVFKIVNTKKRKKRKLNVMEVKDDTS